MNFVRDVQPIFRRHCYRCHGGSNEKGGLTLSSRRVLTQPGDSGEVAIMPGKSGASWLMHRLTDADYGDLMPLDGQPLAANEIRLLRRWIDEGANWPTDLEEDRHWSYVAPVRPDLPSVSLKQWPTNAIDYFILNRLETEGLTPSSREQRGVLLRRVSLALTGLPPTREELTEFLADESPQAYEAAVDRLLASKHYGERWAQHWLDLARYADSNGFQADQLRDSWAYRDWVIRAFNRNQPFNQFVVDQLAGDLLPNATVEQKIATGFHRTPTCNVEAGVHPEENRVNQVFDRVNTTGIVFLGTSLECAQCHDHKYDPFTQKEYYQLFAYFNNTPLEVRKDSGVQYDFFGPLMELPLSETQAQRKQRLTAEVAAARAKLQTLRQSRRKEFSSWEQALRARLQASPAKWQAASPTEIAGTGGETFRPLDDGSVLVSGTVPNKTTYILRFTNPPRSVQGLKVECLTHPELPGRGPGRGDKVRRNFILSELEFTRITADGQRTRVPLTGAAADFSQKQWPVQYAIDGKPNTGWAIAPQFGKDHWASFQTKQALQFDPSDVVELKLVQNYGSGRTIGRLRVSFATGDRQSWELPEDLRLALLAEAQRKEKNTQAIDRDEQLRQKLLDHYVSTDPRWQRWNERVQALQAELDGIPVETTLVMMELPQPRSTRMLMRGNYLTPGDEVQPGVPATLHDVAAELPPNRLGFARWLVSRENPLLARVTVNRWWAELFGRGLVATPEDFGTQGELPTHPQLLDWLAVEFMESGWSTKHVHKLMVMSSAFQQSSRFSERLTEADPENRWLGRGPRFRLSAEMIRDNALRISGLLSTRMYGQPIMPYQPGGIWKAVGRNQPKWVTATDENRYRRGVYVVWKRGAPYPSFVNFDAPDRAACTVQRPRTNTPLQALTLLNDPAYAEMAAALAQRVLIEVPENHDETRLRHAFELCTARKPTAREVGILRQLLQRERLRADNNTGQVAQRVNNLLERVRDDSLDAKQLAVWTAIANVLLNLDETITLH